MTLTGRLVEKLISTQYEDIPEVAKEVARQVCLDGIGVALAGIREPLGLGRLTHAYTRQIGGKEEATVFGAGFRSSAQNAAYANGTLCHALDFDNTWWPLNHPTSPTLPAILAIAERDRLPGRDVITALVLAFEVQGRMRVASAGIMAGTSFHKPGVSGLMGAVTASGKLMALNAQRFLNAFGIGGSRAGSMSANTGTMTKSSHSGHAARMGVEASALAALGWTAHEDIFGAGGFFELFYGRGNADPELLLKDFGLPYRMVDPGVGFKKYPCNYFTHRPVDAMLELQRKHSLRPEQVAKIVVDFPRVTYVDRPAPKSGLDGKFSIQYTTSAALLDRRITIESFADERRFATDMCALLPLVQLNVRDDIPTGFDSTWAAVHVHTKGGQVLSARCDRPRGIWGLPLTRDERLAKFRNCVDGLMSAGQAEDLIGLVESMDSLQGIQPIMDLVACSSAGKA